MTGEPGPARNADVPQLEVGERLSSYDRVFTVNAGDLANVAAMRAVLIDAARQSAKVTYGELVEEAELPVPPRRIGRLLVLLSVDCERRGEPTLASIVVTKASGEVGDGYGGGAARDRAAVYRYWSTH